jgi:uncharacterized membrane protein
MKKTFLKIGALSAAIALPMIAGAQQALNQLQTLINSFGRIVSTLIPIAFAIGVLAFFWGLGKWIFSAGDEGARDEGKNIMIWGLVALFVMSSVWGIVRLAQTTLGVDSGNTNQINLPHVNGL